jgi:Fur family transcriptional regulator, peroxide stress response regulator
MDERIRHILKEKGLKVTPQRSVVLEALLHLNNHPTAENIIHYVKNYHSNVGVGTVYKTLEIFVEHQLVKKVKTDRDIMRYDSIIEHHHHLYCESSDRIEDYFDDELDEMICNYFSNKNIPGFELRDFKLQLTGNFKK